MQLLYYSIPFIIRCRTSVVLPRVLSYFNFLRTTEPLKKIGAAGFCFGGRYAILLSHFNDSKFKTPDGRPLVDACFTAHPSLLSIPKDIEQVQLPLSIAVGSKDMFMPMNETKKVKAILEKKKNGEGEVVVYDGAIHSECCRRGQA
jgi:dienelactone hydrolase